MSIRKREWKGKDGKTQTRWLADYVTNGHRYAPSFKTRKDAEEFLSSAKVEIRSGIHTPSRKSITVAEAGNRWLKNCETEGLERTTLESYRLHLNRHIVPFIGDIKLGDLTAPSIKDFKDRLHEKKRSASMIRRVVGDLGSILAHAQEEGRVAQNVVRSASRHKKQRGKKRGSKLEIGVHLPSIDEVKAVIAKTDGREKALLLVAAFAGLRSSELRGLRWRDVELKTGEITIRQRADRYGAIGAPKSDAGTRTVRVMPTVTQALRELKLKSSADLVFANGRGKVDNHSNIVQRIYHPAQIAAGVTSPVLDEAGKPTRDEDGKAIVKAKYSGLHTLRHFFASWSLGRKEDGGRGLPLNNVKHIMGHASIQMTGDRYGHFLPSQNDDDLVAADKNLFAKS